MAYPSTPVVFTTKTAGAVVQAAHVNDLQTEVTALETALLTTGIAHSLNPSGDSTRLLGSSGTRWIIHGSQVTDGTLPLTALSSGTLPANVVPATAQHALVTIGSTQDYTSTGVDVGVTWNVQESITSTAMHSTASNSSRLSVVSSGVWMVGVTLLPIQPIGYLKVSILKNDAVTVARTWSSMVANLTNGINASAMVRCSSASDYFTVQYYGNSTTRFYADATLDGNRFWINRVL